MSNRTRAFTNLPVIMKAENIKQDDLANALNMHRNTLKSKLDGVSEFNFNEVEVIKTMFNKYNYDYLFAREFVDNQIA